MLTRRAGLCLPLPTYATAWVQASPWYLLCQEGMCSAPLQNPPGPDLPSRPGFTLSLQALRSLALPQSPGQSKEPGFPGRLVQGCGSQPASAGTDPVWANPKAGLPTLPFLCASQPRFWLHKHCQSPPSSAQPSAPQLCTGLCPSPNKPKALQPTKTGA